MALKFWRRTTFGQKADHSLRHSDTIFVMAEQGVQNEVNRVQSVFAPSPTDVPATNTLDPAARAAGASQPPASIDAQPTKDVSLPGTDKESTTVEGGGEGAEARQTSVRYGHSQDVQVSP